MLVGYLLLAGYQPGYKTRVLNALIDSLFFFFGLKTI